MESDEGDLVFYGTPIEREEDITSRKKKAVTEASGQLRTLPSWKEEVTDEEGRRRFYGVITAGSSAGYHNTVGSQEGWTPSSFTSSRKNRAEIKQQDIYNFLDEDEKADLESRSLGTSMQFDTFGFTAVELARKQAEKEQQQRPSANPGPVPDEIVAPIMESVDSIRAGKVEESVPTGRDSLSFAESGRGDKATEATDKEIEVDVKVENVERPVDLYKAIFSDDSDDEGKSSNSSQVDDPEKKIEVANTTLSRLIAGDFLGSLGKELGLEVPPDLPCSEGNVSAESAQKESINVNGEKERLQVGKKSSTHNGLGGNSTSHESQEVQPYHLEANQEGRSHAHDTTDGEVYRSSNQINVKSNGDSNSSKIDETGVIKSDASENKLVKVPQEDRKSKTSKSGLRHWTSSSPEDESSRKSRRYRRSSSNSDSDTSSSSDDHEDRHRSRSKKKMKGSSREKSSTRSHSEHHKHKRKDSSSSSRHGSQKERREVKKERHKHKDRG